MTQPHVGVHTKCKVLQEQLDKLDSENKAKKLELQLLQQEINQRNAQIMKIKRQQDTLFNDAIEVEKAIQINVQRYNQARAQLIQEVSQLQLVDQEFQKIREITETENNMIIEQRQIVESLVQEKQMTSDSIRELSQQKQQLNVDNKKLLNEELMLQTQSQKMEYQQLVVKSKM